MINGITGISHSIKEKGKSLGFNFIGFSKAEKLEEEEQKLNQWLKSGYQGEMAYLEDHFEKRLDPSKLMPGAKSVISLMFNYFPENEMKGDLKIAKYAYGRDYHKVIKKRLKEYSTFLNEIKPNCKYRLFVDSAPVMERQWAAKAGLGWIGKNGLLINKEKGSFFFLADILVDFELEYDSPIDDFCGDCTKCLDACPTKAFPEPYLLNASKCISYATIELKEEKFPEVFKGAMDNWIFGCDVCQEVCPWNRFSSHHSEESFTAKPTLLEMTKKEWENLSEEKFEELFSGSAVKRTKYSGLKRNISFVTEH